MKYLPVTAYVLGVCGVVITALFITREAGAIWALLLLIFVHGLLPEKE